MQLGHPPIFAEPWPIIVPKDSGPPTNADGVPTPTSLPGTTGPVAQVAIKDAGLGSRWQFVAAPRPPGPGLVATLNFFAQIELVNNSNDIAFYPITAFPQDLAQSTAKVGNDPQVDYDLSQYWVAMYYLGDADGILLPNAAGTPTGVVTWIKPMLDVTVKKPRW